MWHWWMVLGVIVGVAAILQLPLKLVKVLSAFLYSATCLSSFVQLMNDRNKCYKMKHETEILFQNSHRISIYKCTAGILAVRLFMCLWSFNFCCYCCSSVSVFVVASDGRCFLGRKMLAAGIRNALYLQLLLTDFETVGSYVLSWTQSRT